MDCKTSSTLIMNYVDKTIKENEWANLQEHMNNCNQCQEEFKIFTEMLDLFEDVPMYEPSKTFEDKVMASIDKSLYTEKVNKWLGVNAIILSIGIYLTFVLPILRQGLSKDSGGITISGSKLIQQYNLISNIVEKVIFGGLAYLVYYPQKLMQYFFGLFTKSSFGFFTVYFISFIILALLLKVIKRTLSGLLVKGDVISE